MRRKFGKITLIGLLRLAAIAAVLFSFLTGFDIPHPHVELFSHFRLQYLAVSVLLLVAFAALRSPAYAGALLVTAVFNAVLVAPWYLGDPPHKDGDALTMVHANVHSSSTDYDRLIEFVREESPDIVVLQEVTSAWIDGVKPLLTDYPHAYTESRQGNFGIAAYSKLPFDSIAHIDSPPLGHPTIVATLTVSDHPLTLVSTHPTIPVGRQLYDARNRHLDSVADIVKGIDGKVILLGDFNASLWCPKLKRLERATGLVNARKGVGVLPSWPTFLPFAMIPIDHALMSEGIGVDDIRVGRRIGSDHLPLVVTFSL